MVYKAIDRWNSPSLEHYGVKGMKWGVRKAVDRVRSYRKKRNAYKNEKAIRSGNPKKILKRFNKMSDSELQSAISRLNLKQTIKQANSKNEKSQNGGKKPDGIIKKNLKNTVDDFVGKSMSAAVTSLITKEKFSDTLKRKYGGKSSQDKIDELSSKFSSALERRAKNTENQKKIAINEAWLEKNASEKQSTSSKNKNVKNLNKAAKTPVANIKNSKNVSEGETFVKKKLGTDLNVYRWDGSKYTSTRKDYYDYLKNIKRDNKR